MEDWIGRAWLPWDEAPAVLTFEAERERVRRARKAYPQVGKSVEDFTGGDSNGCY
ncbi:MAG: hypothetical protein IMY80_06735 [Chloroflexi bacterium]|nr:hypothetical protein [Chloroflexota bacterium]